MGSGGTGSLVGGIIGGVIGFFAGGNVYAGYAIGSMIGGSFDPPIEYKNTGPKLTDLKVTNSSYSVGKPRFFGTSRVSGNVIESTQLQETKNVEVIDEGKGGPGTETTNETFTYSVTCAYALGEGVINGVRKIWESGKLVSDMGSGNFGFIGNLASSIKVYRGTEEQLPDPSLEQVFGAGNVPAYRGTAYVVFTNLQLEQFGNRLPNFTFEVVRSNENTTVGLYDRFEYAFGNGPHNWIQYNDINRFMYMNRSLPNGLSLFKFDAVNNTVYKEQAYPTMGVFSSNHATKDFRINIINNGDLVIAASSSGSGTINLIEQDTLRIKRTYGIATWLSVVGGSLNWPGYTGASFRTGNNLLEGRYNKYWNISRAAPGNLVQFLSFGRGARTAENEFLGYQGSSKDDDFYPIEAKFPTAVDYTTQGTGARCSLDWGNVAVADTPEDMCYWATSYTNYTATGTAAIVLSKFEFNYGNIEDFYHVIYQGSDDKQIEDMYLDPLTRCIYFLIRNITPVNDTRHIMVFDIDNKTVIKDILLADDDGPLLNFGNNAIFNINKTQRKMYWNSSSNDGSVRKIVYYHMDNDVIETFQTNGSDNTSWDGRYVNSERSDVNPYTGAEFYFGTDGSSAVGQKNVLKNYGMRLATGTYPLSLTIKEIIKDSELSLLNVDVSELEDIQVRGYVIANTSEIRSCLAQLAIAYNFDMCESDHKLKFRLKGRLPIRTIPSTDVSALNYSPDMRFDTNIATTRKQELELFKTINVNYADVNRDYQTNTQECRFENVQTNSIQNIDLPMVFHAVEAKRIADRLMDELWTSRDTYTFQTNYKYIDLEPCDVIQIENIVKGQKVLYTVRLTKKEKGGGILKWTGVAEDTSVFTQVSEAFDGNNITQTIPMISTSKTYFMDIPMLQNNDNDPGMYVATVRQNPSAQWTGSSLSMSDQSSGNYVAQTSFFKEITSGIATTLLPNFAFDNIIDRFSTVEVELNTGTLTSVSEDNILNGYNTALIGNEIVQFQNATSLGSNRYRLDTFLRARFGTEMELNRHEIGDRFVILNASSKTINRILKESSLLNTTRYYKNTTFKDTLQATAPISFINTGVSLRPLAVNNVQGLRTANTLYVKFNKRVRGVVILQDFKDVYDPDGDYYEVEIYSNNTFTTIKRIFQVQGSTEFQYSAADQISDFGVVQPTVYLKIFKTNKIIGRGLPTQATL